MTVNCRRQKLLLFLLASTVATSVALPAEEKSAPFLPAPVQRMIDGRRNVTVPDDAYLRQPLRRSQTLMRLPGSKNFLVVEDMVPKEDEDSTANVATRVSVIKPVRNKAGYVWISKSPVIKSVLFRVERSMSWEGFDTQIATVDKSPVLLVDDWPGGNGNIPHSIIVSLDPKHMLEVAGRAMFLDDDRKRSDEFGMLLRLGWSRSDISHAEIPEAFVYCTVKKGRLTPHKARCQANWDGEISWHEERIRELLGEPASGNRNHNVMLCLVNIAWRQWLMGEKSTAWETLHEGLTRIADDKGNVCVFGEGLSGGNPVKQLEKELREWIGE